MFPSRVLGLGEDGVAGTAVSRTWLHFKAEGQEAPTVRGPASIIYNQTCATPDELLMNLVPNASS